MGGKGSEFSGVATSGKSVISGVHPLITSAANPRIKALLALEKSRDRRETGLFVFEGIKELELALASHYTLTNVYFCPDLVNTRTLMRMGVDESMLIPVSFGVFERLAYRESTGGILAVARQRPHTLDQFPEKANPLYLVLEGVEKPGNLGALLRTADAAGIDGVIVADPATDFYNPNVIRSSVGCLFTVPVARATSEQAIDWLKSRQISLYATYLRASKPYYEVDLKKGSAIIMGTESTGLTDLWVAAADQCIIIPMAGVIDSMNVSTAAAVVIFEACRQRGFGIR